MLITGCSSGIGRVTALYLLSRGYRVVATSRTVSAMEQLARAGATVRPLDVTDEESAAKVVADIEAEHGAVGALVNNAGYAEYGPVETVSLERARAQFETNFFGLARMCQLVLPGMRRTGRGRIVNMSSVGGRIAFPGGGVYNASKFAVEALSDALRFEVEPLGVSVSVIEPNLIRDTRFDEHVDESMRRNTDESGPYRDLRQSIVDQLRRCFTSPRMASPATAVATVVDHALSDPRPRTRYLVSPSGRFFVGSKLVMSDRQWDRVIRRQFGLTESGAYTGKYAQQ
ncbi:SDR family NAD(P)-dependent oxidoreductase [Micromonospora echinofusca]|uniref:SDR family NAD(P)-dependent oxidoreductase n=1 Tax=Micromonospora echinofusca TaxID=47858 RepID=UPI0027DAD465|nr:SDR family NAD(P)-dependent oxidoreductase [Micromonospora echinofusca]